MDFVCAHSWRGFPPTGKWSFPIVCITALTLNSRPALCVFDPVRNDDALRALLGLASISNHQAQYCVYPSTWIKKQATVVCELVPLHAVELITPAPSTRKRFL